MSLNEFYVYQYLNEDGSPFYIGKGSKNRINESHLPWVKIPLPACRQIIKSNLTELEAFDLELLLIKKYGRKIDGGLLENKKISRWVAQAGWLHSEETKEKISIANRGKIRTDAHREKYKIAKTEEHANNIKQAVSKLWADSIYKEHRLNKIKETPFAHKGKPWSPARRDAQLKRQLSKGAS